MFVGQDNRSVGGTDKYSDGYVDHIGLPAGITHYVYFAEGVRNDFGYAFDVGAVDGLSQETRWGAGPMDLASYLSEPALDNTIIHLSVSMEFGGDKRTARGEFDHLIDELGDFLIEHKHRPFILRIGYEFDGSWNDYDPQHFKDAWRRIVDKLTARNINNFATCMGASRYHVPKATWEAYWPGDEYVDWLGYSYWTVDVAEPVVFDLAREKGLPVFVAEATPRGFFLPQLQHGAVWGDWFENFFSHVEANKDVIRAFSYINTHWDADPMWSGWGDSRIQTNPSVMVKWQEKMALPRYVISSSDLFESVGFGVPE